MASRSKKEKRQRRILKLTYTRVAAAGQSAHQIQRLVGVGVVGDYVAELTIVVGVVGTGPEAWVGVVA